MKQKTFALKFAFGAMCVLITAVSTALAMTRPAEPITTYACSNGFDLVQSREGGQYYYALSGNLDMPTPGYGYNVIPNRAENPDQFTIAFEKPEGMAAQVISSLEISHQFLNKASLTEVTYNLKDAANWQADQIQCQQAG